MKSLLKAPMPHWAGDRLLYVWCTRCAWRHSVDSANAEFPGPELEQKVRADFEAHDCAAYPEAS